MTKNHFSRLPQDLGCDRCFKLRKAHKLFCGKAVLGTQRNPRSQDHPSTDLANLLMQSGHELGETTQPWGEGLVPLRAVDAGCTFTHHQCG